MLTFRADECHHSLLHSKIMRPAYEMGVDVQETVLIAVEYSKEENSKLEGFHSVDGSHKITKVGCRHCLLVTCFLSFYLLLLL